MAMSTSSPGGRIAEINVTPMADVVIVLLIIMMFTVPFLNEGRVRNLPETTQSQRLSGEIVVSVAADASVDLGGTRLERDELFVRLRSLLADSREPRVQLKVDRDLAYSALLPVLTECRRAGAAEIDFVTRPRPTR